MNNPRISIIVPVYNRESLVGETLVSILAQTFPDWECLVVDDRSTDDSYEVIKNYAARDPRIKAFRRPEERVKGAPTCRNIGWENSNGDIVTFFDSDDVIDPAYFTTLVKLMDEHSEYEYGVVPCDKFLVSPDKPVSKPRQFDPMRGSMFEQIISGTVRVCSPNMIWRRSLLERNEMMWREGLRKGQDPDFDIRTVAIATDGIWLDMPTMVHIRLHNEQMARSAAFSKEIGEILINNYIVLFDFLNAKGKMTDKIRELYLKGVLKRNMRFAAIYGNANASRRLYEFFHKESVGFSGAGFLQWKAWLLWKANFFIHWPGSILFKYRNSKLGRKITSALVK